MRVLFLMPHPIEGPSSRFRVYQFADYLRQRGVDLELRPFMSSRMAPILYAPGRLGAKVGVTLWSSLRRLVDLAAARRCDIVYVLREAFPFGPPILERLLARTAGRLVFDFDDAIYSPSLSFRNPLDRLRDWSKPAKLIRMADHVVPGSSYLARYAIGAGAARQNLSVLPTVVDPGLYRPAPRDPSAELTIGWIGTPRGTSYLMPLLPVIEQLRARHPRLRFVFVGSEGFPAAGLPVELRPWQLAREVGDIQSFDIGVMPLPDDEQARGKCGFKLIQYMSCALPVVCSPVGANKEVVAEGVSGFFAGSGAEWVQALECLIADGGRRRAMGAAGRARVQTHYSTQVVAPRLLEILEKTAGTASIAPGPQ